MGPPSEMTKVTTEVDRVRIDKWLWAGASDSLATQSPDCG